MKLTKKEENKVVEEFGGLGLITSLRIVALMNKIIAEREIENDTKLRSTNATNAVI